MLSLELASLRLEPLLLWSAGTIRGGRQGLFPREQKIWECASPLLSFVCNRRKHPPKWTYKKQPKRNLGGTCSGTSSGTPSGTHSGARRRRNSGSGSGQAEQRFRQTRGDGKALSLLASSLNPLPLLYSLSLKERNIITCVFIEESIYLAL